MLKSGAATIGTIVVALAGVTIIYGLWHALVRAEILDPGTFAFFPPAVFVWCGACFIVGLLVARSAKKAAPDGKSSSPEAPS